MRSLNKISFVTALFLLALSTGCEKNEIPDLLKDSILPDNFMVEIPGALSSFDNPYGRVAVESLDGNFIYGHLANFIYIGEEAALVVQDIIKGIAFYRINRPMEINFESVDDGREKNLVVIENGSYDNQEWEFQLTITDAQSEGNADGGKALQVFWNRFPIEGIAILKPYNADRAHHYTWENVTARIDYSETGETGYEKFMVVEITNIPLANPLENPYSMRTLKMSAGKSGDIIDITGNSDHPNALFFSGKTGYDWAFVASGAMQANIGVAEVGLPPNQLDESGRDILLSEYSIKNVFTDEIYAAWPDIDQSSLDTYLVNTDAPGYFAQQGFVSGGVSPGNEYVALENRLPALTPYNPGEVANLVVWFKE